LLEKSSVCPHHEAFLYELFVNTRLDEVTAWGWDESTKENFLKMQWTAQSRHFASEYPNVEHYVIRHEGQLVGRQMTSSTEQDVLLIDIAILPNYRNQGIGTALIVELQELAKRSRKRLRLSVLKTSAAVSLYHRLGFVTDKENDLYYFMKWFTTQNVFKEDA